VPAKSLWVKTEGEETSGDLYEQVNSPQKRVLLGLDRLPLKNKSFFSNFLGEGSKIGVGNNEGSVFEKR